MNILLSILLSKFVIVMFITIAMTTPMTTAITTANLPIIDVYDGSTCSGTYATVPMSIDTSCYLDPYTQSMISFNCANNQATFYGGAFCHWSDVISTVSATNNCGDPFNFTSKIKNNNNINNNNNTKSTMIYCISVNLEELVSEISYNSGSDCTANVPATVTYLIIDKCILYPSGSRAKLFYNNNNELTINRYNSNNNNINDCSGNPDSTTLLSNLKNKCNIISGRQVQYCLGGISSGCFVQNENSGFSTGVIIFFVVIAVIVLAVIGGLYFRSLRVQIEQLKTKLQANSSELEGLAKNENNNNNNSNSNNNIEDSNNEGEGVEDKDDSSEENNSV